MDALANLVRYRFLFQITYQALSITVRVKINRALVVPYHHLTHKTQIFMVYSTLSKVLFGTWWMYLYYKGNMLSLHGFNYKFLLSV